MRIARILVGCWLFIVVASLSALIVETGSINLVLSYASPSDTLVLLDLDNTLVEPASIDQSGSDQWFYARVEQEKARGCPDQEAVNNVFTQYLYIQEHVVMRLVEGVTTAGCVQTLQQQGVPVIVITARQLQLFECTLRQIKNVGLDFTKTAIFRDYAFHCQSPALFSKGVIFCNRNKKSETLEALLYASNFWPKRLVMVDDKLAYLQDIEQFANKHGIEFIGLRYNYLDDKVAAFRKIFFTKSGA